MNLTNCNIFPCELKLKMPQGIHQNFTHKFLDNLSKFPLQQVDVLPSKNQALCDLIYNVLFNRVSHVSETHH